MWDILRNQILFLQFPFVLPPINLLTIHLCNSFYKKVTGGNQKPPSF